MQLMQCYTRFYGFSGTFSEAGFALMTWITFSRTCALPVWTSIGGP